MYFKLVRPGQSVLPSLSFHFVRFSVSKQTRLPVLELFFMKLDTQASYCWTLLAVGTSWIGLIYRIAAIEIFVIYQYIATELAVLILRFFNNKIEENNF